MPKCCAERQLFWSLSQKRMPHSYWFPEGGHHLVPVRQSLSCGLGGDDDVPNRRSSPVWRVFCYSHPQLNVLQHKMLVIHWQNLTFLRGPTPSYFVLPGRTHAKPDRNCVSAAAQCHTPAKLPHVTILHNYSSL